MCVQIIVETYNNGSPTPEFNNAGQIFNHDFYWESLSPEKRESPQPQGLQIKTSYKAQNALAAFWSHAECCLRRKHQLIVYDCSGLHS